MPANTITRIRHLVLEAKNLGGPALSAASDYSLLTVHYLSATHLSAPPSEPYPEASRSAPASPALPLLARTHTSRSSGCPARCPRPYADRSAAARGPRSRGAAPCGSHPSRIPGSSTPSPQSISPARRACGAGPPGAAPGAPPAAPPGSRSTTPGSETALPSAQTARAPTQPSRPAGPNGAANDAPQGRSSTALATEDHSPPPPATARQHPLGSRLASPPCSHLAPCLWSPTSYLVLPTSPLFTTHCSLLTNHSSRSSAIITVFPNFPSISRCCLSRPSLIKPHFS